MNKKFKKAMLGLLVAPCMFLATACGTTPPPEDPVDTFDEADKSAAYVTLRNNVRDFKLPVNATKTAVDIETKNKLEMAFDITNAGLPEQIAGMITMMSGAMNGTYGTKYKMGYSSDNTGYYVNLDFNKTTNAFDTIDELEIVKKSGNDYLHYDKFMTSEYDEEQEDYVDVEKKIVSKVDDKYAPNVFKLKSSEMENGGKLSDISGIFDYILANDSYEKFKTEIDTLASEMLNAEFDLTGQTVSIDIEEKDDAFVLKATLDLNNISMPDPTGEMPVDTMSGNVDATMSITFDANAIQSSEMVAAMDLGATMKTNDFLELAQVDVTVGEDKTMGLSSKVEMTANVDFDAAFDETVMSTDTTSYLGTGENNTIENRKTDIILNYVGIYDSRYVYYSGNNTFGADFDLTLDDEFLESNITIDGIYWDEACTDKVVAGDKIPSYDTKLYVKLSPKEGYAIIRTAKDYGTGDMHEFGFSAYAVGDGYNFEYLTNEYYNVEKIEVNGVVVDPANYAAGLTLESGKIYKVNYTLSQKTGA